MREIVRIQWLGMDPKESLTVKIYITKAVFAGGNFHLRERTPSKPADLATTKVISKAE